MRVGAVESPHIKGLFSGAARRNTRTSAREFLFAPASTGLFKEKKINLEAMFDGDNPFEPLTGQSTLPTRISRRTSRLKEIAPVPGGQAPELNHARAIVGEGTSVRNWCLYTRRFPINLSPND
jgi:hypothetical protein